MSASPDGPRQEPQKSPQQPSHGGKSATPAQPSLRTLRKRVRSFQPTPARKPSQPQPNEPKPAPISQNERPRPDDLRPRKPRLRVVEAPAVAWQAHAMEGAPPAVSQPLTTAPDVSLTTTPRRIIAERERTRCRRHRGLEPAAEPHLLPEVSLDFCDVNVADGDMPVTGGPEADRPPQVVGAVR
jgi:hypothetical protein